MKELIVWLLAVVLVYSVTYISLNNKGVAAVSATPHRAARRMPAAARPNPIGIQAQTAAVLRSRVLRAAPRVTKPSGGNAAAATGVDAAAAAEAINAATAKAVAAGYHWTRSAQYTQPIDVGSATSGLNTLIKGIHSEASLDSVVGGFIGIGDKEMDIEKGGSAAEQIDYHGENYASSRLPRLKPRTSRISRLTATPTPLRSQTKLHLKRINRPLCQDLQTTFSLKSMVDSEIKNFISAAKINSATIEYTNIKATVVIEDVP